MITIGSHSQNSPSPFSLGFFLLSQLVSLGFHPSPTADQLKAKEQNKFRVIPTSSRAYKLPYTPSVHITRTTTSKLNRRVYMNSGRTGASLQSHSGPEPRLCCAHLSLVQSVARASAWWLGATIVFAFHDWKFISLPFFLLSSMSKNQRRALTKISQD
jgi:hypothetical protein